MAAINVSPESFYAGSVSRDAVSLRAAAQRAASEGADIIDIGGMSTAPYLRTEIPEPEEIRRVTWALETVGAAVSLPLSADTKRATVAAAALAAGARIINDVSGLRADEQMAAIAARAEGVVLTASEDRAAEPHAPYPASPTEPVSLVRRVLVRSLERARAAGIAAERIVLDPGIGFFTRAGQPPDVFSCGVLDQLRTLLDLGSPLLIGVSRKSFIATITGKTDPAERLWGSLAATAVAVYNGAAIVRTHDVAATRDAVRIAAAIRSHRA
ncbi:MAG: dihydropteroate synthase [Acidobacteria bacterium RBG_16_68_9]|nr:MAG: dihydropteroate synthase [Acidobacteria bacterium RBG_16_68_9]